MQPKLLLLFLLISVIPSECKINLFEDNNPLNDIINGILIGSAYNKVMIVLELKGRASNMLVFTKRFTNQWWVRLDRPHRNVEYFHWNINPLISGVPDPHTSVSAVKAYFYQSVGYVVKIIDYAAPVIFIVSVGLDAKDIYYSFNESKKSGFEKLFETISEYIFGFIGAFIGSIIGTLIKPALGTMIGGLLGPIATLISWPYLKPFVKRIFIFYWNDESHNNSTIFD